MMFIKKNIFVLLLFIFCSVNFLKSQDFVENKVIINIDKLDYDGHYKKALDLCLVFHKKDKQDLRLVWRMGIEALEISALSNDKNEKLKIINYPITILKKYINVNFGTIHDRSLVIYWYTVLYATKIKLQGLFAGREAFSIVPNVFKLLDKCLEIDPNNYNVFFFLGKFYGDLPRFMGGDKLKMEICYKKAILAANKDEINIFKYDFALSLLNRNWDVKKKKEKKISKKEKNFFTLTKDDKKYAKEILSSIIVDYKNKKEHSLRENQVFGKTKKLLESLK